MKTLSLRTPRFVRDARSALAVAALAALALVAAACSDGATTGGGATGGLDAAQLESLARSLGLPPSVIGGSTGIHVSGVGEASAKPDIAVLSLGVEGQARTPAPLLWRDCGARSGDPPGGSAGLRLALLGARGLDRSEQCAVVEVVDLLLRTLVQLNEPNAHSARFRAEVGAGVVCRNDSLDLYLR